MRIFTCLFNDRRYSVPTLSILLSTDADHARELARQELKANRNRVGFELLEGDRLVWIEGA